MKNEFSVSTYAMEVWESQENAKIIRQVASADWSACYEMDAAHVFELDNGKFLFVEERGCSCYGYEDASLTIVDTEEQALEHYREAQKDL